MGWARARRPRRRDRLRRRCQTAPARLRRLYDTTTLAIAINEAASASQRVKTLVHELGRALVRTEPADDEALMAYDEEELVVESVAFTVCGSLGTDTSSDSIPYLASLSENADLATIERAAATIDRIARRIENALNAIGGFERAAAAGLRDAT
jgi:antirestriction protein ArdC